MVENTDNSPRPNKPAKTPKTQKTAKIHDTGDQEAVDVFDEADTMDVTPKTHPLNPSKPNDTWIDQDVVNAVKKLTKPAVIGDIKAMYSGRTAWRRTATVTETMGKASLAISTVLAFASASEIVNDTTSRVLGFVAGSVGTLGLVLTSFANFARNQAIERTDAANMILGSVRVDRVPDINQELVISDGGDA